MAQELHLKTAMIAAGSLFFAGWCAAAVRARSGKAPWRWQSWIARRLPELAAAHFGAALALLTGGFALAAGLAKLSQLRTFALNGEDFWLFQDMLAQMMRGGFLLTRYAPQAQGWVQHGAVHPMLSWALALPLAWLLGPTAAALLFGPLVFAGAGWVLALIAKPRSGALGALLAAAAFLASSQVGKILMYDVHPEAAYPLFVFLWAWSAGWGDGKTRGLPLLLSTALLMGIKEDSFVVLPPLLLATALFRREASRLWLGLSAALALAVCLLQFAAVHQWTSGAWGPAEWEGARVQLPAGADLLKNRRWDAPSSALSILSEILGERGGLPGAFAGFARFLFSRPWLSLLLVAPWVILQPAFWVSVLPLAGVYSLLDEPGKFINYYSAPVLGLFWLAALTSRFRGSSLLLWLFGVSLVLGGGGVDFYLASDQTLLARQEVSDLLPCLPAQAKGVVSSRFLALVPPLKILSDRIPGEALVQADFYLFSKVFPSFEIQPPAAEKTSLRLRADPHWTLLGKGCQPVGVGENPLVLLFVKRS